MTHPLEDIYICAGCDGQYIYGDEQECSQCDNLYCPECKGSCGLFRLTNHTPLQICVECVNEATEQNRIYKTGEDK